jgi:GLPGLI family protein
MRITFAIIIALIITLLFSCKKIEFKDRIKEGYIDYSIEYLDDTLDRFIVGLLPKKMTVKFKNNNTLNKIESLSGIVSFTHIQNSKDNKNITLVRVLNKKYKYSEVINESSLFFDNVPEIKIEPQNELKNIAGLNCTKALVTIPDGKTEPFYIYYTNDIIIHNPNAHTPYRTLDGVLLEFQVKMYNMNMKLTATKIVEDKIESDEFKIPEGYIAINRKTMEEILSLLKK